MPDYSVHMHAVPPPPGYTNAWEVLLGDKLRPEHVLEHAGADLPFEVGTKRGAVRCATYREALRILQIAIDADVSGSDSSLPPSDRA